MRIEDFPRPPDDNGRGLHWSAWVYHDRVRPSLDHWIDELQAMKIKWLKLLDDGGGSSLDFCRRLVDAGIMPIVRIYLEPANPNYLRGRHLDTVSRLVDVGARYFESNNEPDLPAEWEGNRLPDNWLDVVIDNFIRDADAVLERGGLLALPAMGPGSRDNPIARVVAKGRKDLFERGCWVAIHNYTLNHPLDYPEDEVNQQGRSLTQEEYDAYAAWAYSHLTYEEIVAQGLPVSEPDYHKFNTWAWGGRSLEMVNDLRRQAKNPGDTIFDDPNCFRGWEAAGKMILDALGFHVPVISTEGGPVVGWGDDLRYPKVNPTTQKDWQVEIVRFLQSQAPPWYFAMCTWLIATEPLGQINPTWEQMSWYTHAWDLQFGLEGQLPVVQALKAEPSVVRPELQPAPPSGDSALRGILRLANGEPAQDVPLRLQGTGGTLQSTSDQAGAFQFEELAAGTYRLQTRTGEVLVEEIALDEGETRDLHLTLPPGQHSTLEGTVIDTAGRPQANMQITVGKGEEQGVAVRTNASGQWQVEGLSQGSYWAITGDGDAAVAGVRLNGWNSVAVDLTIPAPAGYLYVVAEKRLLSREETGNDRKFFGRVLDEAGEGLNGITVEMAWLNPEPGTVFPRQVTPKDPFKAAGNFEFLHSPGEFVLRVVEEDWPSDQATGLKTTGVPGREGDPITYEVNFQRLPTGEASGVGEISGVIRNAPDLGLTLWREPAPGESGRRSWAKVLEGPADEYRFSNLPAGTYLLELEGEGSIGRVDLTAAQMSAVFDYAVTQQPPATGTIAGTVVTAEGAPAPGIRVLLYRGASSPMAETSTDEAGQFGFRDLEEGTYQVQIAEQPDLDQQVTVSAGETQTVSFTLPATPHGSALLGHLAYSDGRQAAGLLVWVISSAGDVFSTRTDVDGDFRIDHLEADSYDLFVEHPTVGQLLLQADLVLDGVNDEIVSFDDLASPPVKSKPIPAYVLFGQEERDRLLLELALPYLRTNGLTGGFSLEEAQNAYHVTIVGGEDVASEADEWSLLDSGCRVVRLPGDPFELAEALGL